MTNQTRSALGNDFPGKGLGDDLAVANDEGVGGELVDIVRGLGAPDDVRGLALDDLLLHLERSSWFGELREERLEKRSPLVGAPQNPVGCKENGLVGEVFENASRSPSPKDFKWCSRTCCVVAVMLGFLSM